MSPLSCPKNGAWARVGRVQDSLVCSLSLTLGQGSSGLCSLLVLSLSEHEQLGNLEKILFFIQMKKTKSNGSV